MYICDLNELRQSNILIPNLYVDLDHNPNLQYTSNIEFKYMVPQSTANLDFSHR